MATLKDTKRRIVSVKSTQKITRAMKLVSSAKYARAHQAVTNAKPYAQALQGIVNRLVSSGAQSPFLHKKAEQNILLVVVASDRGLCGGFNSNTLKTAKEFLNAKKVEGKNISLALWGKRCQVLKNYSSSKVVQTEEKTIDKPTYERAEKYVEKLLKVAKDEGIEHIYFCYPKFRNALVQQPTLVKLLPFEKNENYENSSMFSNEVVEPSIEKLLDFALKKIMVNIVFGIMLDSSASEHAARMAAMDSATNNADDVIRDLTLDYNRARQAAITKELIEITSGAEAL